MMPGPRQFLILSLTLLLLLPAIRERAFARSVVGEPLGDLVNGTVIREVDRAGRQISDLIFDQIDDLKVYGQSTDTYNWETKIARHVFDNADILSSYTVVDKFALRGGIPLYSLSDLVPAGFSTGNVGFSISTDAGIDLVNIRQVLPKEIDTLPSAEDRKKELDALGVENMTKNAAPERSKSKWVFAFDENGKKKYNFLPSPEDQARYSKFWNIIAFPLRLPLTAGALKHLTDGEIISYLGRGTVTLGPSVGWNLDPTGISGVAQVGVSYATFLNGQFRISILKEKDNFAKVKITRIGTWGHALTAGSNYRPNVLDGIIIVKDLQNSVKMVPFNMSVGQSFAKSFDVGYEYNLSIPEAREAYDHAVTGRLALSDELAIDEKGAPRNFEQTGVKKIFSRRAKTETRTNSTGNRLGFFFRHNANSAMAASEAVIVLPDGTHHIFNAVATNNANWAALWGSREKSEHIFTVSLDMDRYDRSGALNDSLVLMVEGRLEDNDTSPNELLKYILEVEDSIGKPLFFPRVPATNSTGRSNFYYQLALSAPQVTKFMNTPKKDMWPALEKAFGVREGAWSTKSARSKYAARMSPLTALSGPLYPIGYQIEPGVRLIHATRIHSLWERISRTQDPQKRAELLGRMFYDKTFGFELTRLLRTVLNGESVSYYVSGYSQTAFDRKVDQGGSLLNFDNIATQAQRLIDFDIEGSRTRDMDPKAAVTNLDGDVIAPDKVEIHFELQQAPKSLFVTLRINNWWWPFHNGSHASIRIENNGTFHQGENIVVVDRNDKESPFHALAELLAPGNVYTFSIAVTNDNAHWGSVSSFGFRVRKPEEPAIK